MLLTSSPILSSSSNLPLAIDRESNYLRGLSPYYLPWSMARWQYSGGSDFLFRGLFRVMTKGTAEKGCHLRRVGDSSWGALAKIDDRIGRDIEVSMEGLGAQMLQSRRRDELSTIWEYGYWRAYTDRSTNAPHRRRIADGKCALPAPFSRRVRLVIQAWAALTVSVTNEGA